jgi:hypothetical protein
MNMQPTPAGYVDKPFTYPFQIAMTQGQAFTNQTLGLDSDGDFYLRGMWASFPADGLFTFNWAGPGNYFYWTSQISNLVLSTNAGKPEPVQPTVWYPAGGRILINITDASLTPGTRTYYVNFHGVKRFRLGDKV